MGVTAACFISSSIVSFGKDQFPVLSLSSLGMPGLVPCLAVWWSYSQDFLITTVFRLCWFEKVCNSLVGSVQGAARPRGGGGGRLGGGGDTRDFTLGRRCTHHETCNAYLGMPYPSCSQQSLLSTGVDCSST